MSSDSVNNTIPAELAGVGDAKYIPVPNTLVNFPWPKAVNPHGEECSKSSHEWLASFEVLSPKALAIAEKSQNGYLASLAWPQLPKDGLQIGCDLLNAFYLLNEVIDRCSTAQEARILVDCFMDALRHPDKARPEEGEWKGARVGQSLMQRMISCGTSQSCIKRFIPTMQHLCDGLVEQAGDRSKGHVRDVDSYFERRWQTIGVYPCFVMIQHEMDMPDEVYKHEMMRMLEQLACYLVILDHDLISCSVEQARGEKAHNLVKVAMNQFGAGLEETIYWVGEYHKEVMKEFLCVHGKILAVFPGEKDVERYVWGVGNWVRANWQWSREAGRYFPNKDGLSLEQNGGLAALLPKPNDVLE